MSYSLSIPTAIEKDQLEDQVNVALEEYCAAYPGQDTPQMRDHIEAAIEAATQLAEVVGEGPITVTISGHANQGHRPIAGWSNDFVQLTVSSAARPEQDPASEDAERAMLEGYRS